MKTKLLKKVRKQYTITQIDELASNAGSEAEEAAKQFGFPFFMLTTTSNPYTVWFNKTFEGSRNRLWREIFREWGEKFRHNPGKYKKVWHNG